MKTIRNKFLINLSVRLLVEQVKEIDTNRTKVLDALLLKFQTRTLLHKIYFFPLSNIKPETFESKFSFLDSAKMLLTEMRKRSR